MGGLACGEISQPAWPIVARRASAFMAIDDAWAKMAMRMRARPAGNDAVIVAGESGAAGLAGLLALRTNGAAARSLGLSSDSRVLLFITESDTDPVSYREIVRASGNENQEIG
jgi:diaminopropionate ammonia-lyase